MKKDDPGRKTIHRGRVVDLGVETVQLPDGRRLELEVVRHPGGAVALALDEKRRVCLIRQWRHAAGGWIWEAPAGKIDPGETGLSTAMRELREEAGLEARQWDALGEFLTTPGFCDEVIHLYLARGLTHVGQEVGEHECLEVHWVDWDEAMTWAGDGTIRDAKTLLALYRARDRLRQPPMPSI